MSGASALTAPGFPGESDERLFHLDERVILRAVAKLGQVVHNHKRVFAVDVPVLREMNGVGSQY